MRVARFLMLVGMAVSTGGCMSYVALGDSYTSGPVIRPQIDAAGCQRSRADYPRLVSSSLPGTQLHDVSCAGATTIDMTEAQRVSDGFNPPQLDAVGPATQLVTLTLGANDIGLMQILYGCTSRANIGTPCRDRYVSDGRDQIANRIDSTAGKIAGVLRDIRRRAPHARVFVLAYLQILPSIGRGCFPQVPITDGDVAYLRNEERRLNAVIEFVTVASRDFYVDAFDASVGRDACQPASVRWIEPATAVDAAPMHPNESGMQASARLLVEAMHHHGV